MSRFDDFSPVEREILSAALTLYIRSSSTARPVSACAMRAEIRQADEPESEKPGSVAEAIAKGHADYLRVTGQEPSDEETKRLALAVENPFPPRPYGQKGKQ